MPPRMVTPNLLFEKREESDAPIVRRDERKTIDEDDLRSSQAVPLWFFVASCIPMD